METLQAQEAKAVHDESEDNSGQLRALVGFGIPVFIAGVFLLVGGIRGWGLPAVAAGVVLGVLGLAFLVIAATSSTRDI